MKRTLLSLLVVLLALPVLAGGSKKAGVVKAKGKKIEGKYIVVFEDRVANVDALSDDLVVKHRGRKNHVYKTALKGFSAELSEKEALALSQNPSVKYVEEDAEVTIGATQTNATWGLDRIDQRDLPLNQTYVYNATGSGVKAYIVDTGILTTHTDFGGRAISGHDAVDGSLPATDCHGHGTHVAGTVGGATWGVAKSVTLVAVRVLDCNGSGSNSGVIAGVNWVASDHAAGQPAVANMSLGGGASQALDDAVNAAINDGVTFAIAAGNGDQFGNPQNACNYSPARVANAITVGATTSTDARSSFSNYGTCLDIFAPGNNITSLWNSNDTATSTISGTSMATPHVAGAAALVLAANPSFTPRQVRDALVNNGSTGKVGNPGSGSPNVLLYTGFIGGGNPDPDPDPDPGQGTPRNDRISGSLTLRQFRHYAPLTVKPGTQVVVTLSDSVGDADLYVRFGAQPTTSAYTCRPYLDGNSDERCDLTVPDGVSQVFVSVRGYSASTYTGTRAWVEP